MNIQSILKRSALELKKIGISTPDLDAKILLEHALEKDTVFLYANPTRPLTNLEYSKFRRYLRKRKAGIPIAYITGHKEFFGNDFIVNKHTLIPRPESEFLVEQALKSINEFAANKHSLSILDLGTGSGCLIISLAKEFSKLEAQNLKLDCFASDISKKTLNVAKHNAKIQETPTIKFFHSDLFNNPKLHKKFDILIANLPYVPESSDSDISTVKYEPRQAIFADDNGTDIIKKFIFQSQKHLKKKSYILIELDYRNAKQLENYAKTIFPLAKIKLHKDLAKLDRYLIIQNA